MTSAPADTTLAGFEFSPGFVVFLLTAGFVILVYLSIFVGVLVTSAIRMHGEGRLRVQQSWLAVLAPVVLLAGGYKCWQLDPTIGATLIALGLGVGYAVMLRSGHGWFRWTAPVAVLPIVLQVWP